ncbi:hypothetical protein KJ365_13250 [Glaciecola sp. XM2]|jgi:hypothetical protein|uniref:hypothetical protein n=1 Tax=Glaciecola sp. XM2 TaxID=1914931 RepID=UPI001BDF67FF|nr:hypothetical protein [Glaciecola sp. XM2]MBT1451853.1 hypothetical protein [Glaciecola sp. XM2]
MHDTYEPAAGKKSRLKTFIVIGVWVAILAILITAYMRAQSAREAQAQVDTGIKWDPQLLACNEVFDASPTDSFTTCLAMADEGWIDAAQRIAWAYTRDGEHQNWQSVYDWLVWLSDYDVYAELLSYIVLYEIGESNDVKEDGERGIRKMAIINNPAAAAYLASVYYLGAHQLPRQSNITWLLERAYQQSKFWVMPEEIARIYARGFLGKAQPEKAKALLIDATKDDFPLHANNVAWLFATTDSPQLADTKMAVTLAEKVVAEQEYAENYVYVDTLAAAYAADGKFDQAVEAQLKAVDLIKSAHKQNENPSPQLASFEERLALFKAQQPYVIEETLEAGNEFFESFKNQIEQALIDNLYVEVQAPEVDTLAQP